MDWESHIEEVCSRLEIDPEVYNNNDDAKEIVARILGFPSFACFIALPEPADILDGRGKPLLKGHIIQQLPLAESCVALIKQHYLATNNNLELEREVNRFIKYMEENFDDDPAAFGLIKLVGEITEIYPSINTISSIEKYTTKIQKLMGKLIEKGN